jgi:hypothetical protein
MRRAARIGLVLFVSSWVIATNSAAAEPREPSKQVEFSEQVPLLDAGGKLSGWGWARRANMQYDRSLIPAARQARVKEWEHYTVMSPQFTLGITLAQLGPLVLGSAELIDYREQTIATATFMSAGKKDKSIFPADPYGTTRVERGKDFVSMEFEGDKRRIQCRFSKGPLSVPFEAELTLVDHRNGESVAIARPFEGEGQFFYENKIFGMPATGSATVNGQHYTLPAGDAWAIFDWGRGIWPAESKWFWGQAAGKVGERQVAINLGWGYGDDSRGTCNAILVDGKLHKLDIVEATFDANDRMQPWRFTSNDGRLTLDFQPIYNQHSKQDVGFAKAELYKIHGRYSGTLVLDDGTKLEVKDLLGFAEHMEQRW